MIFFIRKAASGKICKTKATKGSGLTSGSSASVRGSHAGMKSGGRDAGGGGSPRDAPKRKALPAHTPQPAEESGVPVPPQLSPETAGTAERKNLSKSQQVKSVGRRKAVPRGKTAVISEPVTAGNNRSKRRLPSPEKRDEAESPSKKATTPANPFGSIDQVRSKQWG